MRRCRLSVWSFILGINCIGLCIIILVNANSRWLKTTVDNYYSPNRMIVTTRSGVHDNAYPGEPGSDVVDETKPSFQDKIATFLNSDNNPSGNVIEDMSRYKYTDILNFIPPVPRVSTSDSVYKLNDSIMERYQKLEPRQYTEKIVILTPIHNSEDALLRYAQQLNVLSYPHHLISVVFGEDDSHDGTLNVAHEVARDLKTFGFARTDVLHFNLSGQIQGAWHDIHHITVQYRRRKHLAQARNLLLKGGLKKEEYVLWIDSDVGFLPTDLVEQLLFAKKDVVVPLCLFSSRGIDRVYDKNTWRETEVSLQDQKNLRPFELVVEGYSTTTRLYLPDLRGEGRVVPIDGVGGCCLMIKADCHRKGLIFPEDIYDHHIETEGLAKMAKKMKFGVYGLPFVAVFHA